MSTIRRVTLVALGALAAALLWYCSRPCIRLTSDTLLWSTEYDASRQASIYPGPGVPAGHVKAGSRLRVVWTAEGKDYRAFLVVGPHWQKGWLLFGQEGFATPRVDAQREPNYRAGVDAGLAFLFAFVSHWPGTTQHSR